MDNTKLDKAKAEIERVKAKITDYQAKLREWEREKIRLENERIVALVRGERISDAELTAFMASLRKGKPAESEGSETTTIQQEETPYEAYIDEE